MDRASIRARFDNLNVWKRGDQRAPHKPLLVLYALGQWQRGRKKLPFPDIEADLEELLVEFGPSRKSYHPEYPFWRLQNDGIWQLENIEGIETRQSNTDAKKTELRARNVKGSFTPDVQQLLESEPGAVYELANELLFAHFPISLHGDIRDAVGLAYQPIRHHANRVMEVDFEREVLAAYEERCAVCGFGAWMGKKVVGVEATHIKWPQAGGPDTLDNAIAFCSLHRSLFDRGAYTVGGGYMVNVSSRVRGIEDSADLLIRYDGRAIKLPNQQSYLPHAGFIDWHHREVFKR